ncbi:MAG: ABC transporter permease [Actinomycetota bacterium]|nr:ABC transporter permease [Actinomycetota bacterium]
MPTDVTLDETLAGLDALELTASHNEHALRRVWRTTWPKAAAVVLALAAWQLVVWLEWKPRFALAPPAEAFEDLWDMATDGTLWTAARITMWRAAQGFAVSIVLGVLVGSAVSRFRPVRAAFGSLITGLQTMPSVAWVPFAIVIFRRDYEAAIMLVMVLGATPSIANGLISGADHIPPILLRAGRVLGARGFSAYRHIILPAALPTFVGGVKQGWAFLWRSLMAAELIAVVPGKESIGFLLQVNRELANSSGLIATMIVILAIGIAVDSVVFGTLDRAIRRRWGLLDPGS